MVPRTIFSEPATQPKMVRGTIFSINSEAVEPVAQGPEGDAEELRGGGLVEARRFERLGDRLALDLVEEVVQGQPPRAERAVERGHALLGARLREVQVRLVDRVLGTESQCALEDVLELAHV